MSSRNLILGVLIRVNDSQVSKDQLASLFG